MWQEKQLPRLRKEEWSVLPIVMPPEPPGTCAWHFRQRLESGWASILRFTEPCGLVASGAAFLHGFVFEDEVPGLFLMALGAGSVLPANSEVSVGAADVVSMWIVAVRTVHLLFEDRMVMGKLELRARGDVALQAGLGGLAGVDDLAFELGASAAGDVFASGTVARFATPVGGCVVPGEGDAGVNAAGKYLADLHMAGGAGLAADKGGSLNMRRWGEGGISRAGARGDEEMDQAGEDPETDQARHDEALSVAPEFGDPVSEKGDHAR